MAELLLRQRPYMFQFRGKNPRILFFHDDCSARAAADREQSVMLVEDMQRTGGDGRRFVVWREPGGRATGG